MHLYTFFVHLQCLTTAIPVVIIDAASRNCMLKAKHGNDDYNNTLCTINHTNYMTFTILKSH